MPNNDKHPAYMMHIDLLPGVKERLVDFCVNLPALICCEENGEESGKPHVHLLTILPKPESKQTLINRLKKHFKDVEFEKSNFSHSVWADYLNDHQSHAKQYVCKGPSKSVKTPPIVLYKNWLDDPLVHHENYWIRNAEIVEENKDKKKKQTYYEVLADDIISELREDGIQSEEVYRVACHKLIHKTKGKINDHVAFPVLQKIEYHFNPTDVKDAFHQRMLKKKSNY